MPQPLEIPRTFRLAHELWRTDPSELVAELNPSTFNPSGTPVLICAKNEAQSLPATLRSLAASEHPVMPVVVDNDSSDETSVVAEQMGARVVRERRPGKMAAFLTGLAYITEEMPGITKILSTDADTVASSRWAGSLVQKLEDHPHDVGGVTFGLVGISGGPSRYTDILRTIVINRRQLINKNRAKPRAPEDPIWALQSVPSEQRLMRFLGCQQTHTTRLTQRKEIMW